MVNVVVVGVVNVVVVVVLVVVVASFLEPGVVVVVVGMRSTALTWTSAVDIPVISSGTLSGCPNRIWRGVGPQWGEGGGETKRRRGRGASADAGASASGVQEQVKVQVRSLLYGAGRGDGEVLLADVLPHRAGHRPHEHEPVRHRLIGLLEERRK